MPYTFFAIRTEDAAGLSVARVLESRIQPPFARSHGFGAHEAAGLPRLQTSELRGEYPFARVSFGDDTLPVHVSLEAFTPFVPLDADASGFPAAVLRWTVRNPGPGPVRVSIAGSLSNLAGLECYERDTWDNVRVAGETANAFRVDGPVRGLDLTVAGLDPRDDRYGSLALLTTESECTHKALWLNGGWWDGLNDFWDDFTADGALEPESRYVAREVRGAPWVKVGSLCLPRVMGPGAEERFTFILAWHFPNRPDRWHPLASPEGHAATVRNWYARRFTGAWHAGRTLAEELPVLEKRSRDFHRALFGSTLPPYVIDALASNITVIRSPTCFRLETGELMAWEGCFDQAGSCEGSCTHVWNYAQTLAFLFPELERTMRRVELGRETSADGRMNYRTCAVFGGRPTEFAPATDGQLGTIVRLYRDWKLSGDDAFLRELWDSARRALDFALGSYWDSDGDHVLDQRQHNTYDVEFFGPSSLTNSVFYAALAAGAAMADHLGDAAAADRWRRAAVEGSRRMDALLWGGEWYVQKLADLDEHRYQYGTGCLSDQVFGQFLAHVAGLGYVLPRAHVQRALASVFRHNFRTSFATHANLQRTYVLNDEKGLLLCSWPRGGRPRLPFIYSDEVWTGIEYQVASHLVMEGLVDEGLTVARAARERHDGYLRNPWNEVECGHHYARSLASWGLLIALSGFTFDMGKRRMGFAPAINQEGFSCFWSTGRAWGIYRQRVDPATGRRRWEVETLFGDLSGVEVNGEAPR